LTQEQAFAGGLIRFRLGLTSAPSGLLRLLFKAANENIKTVNQPSIGTWSTQGIVDSARQTPRLTVANDTRHFSNLTVT
jgi:hypothetical protein